MKVPTPGHRRYNNGQRREKQQPQQHQHHHQQRTTPHRNARIIQSMTLLTTLLTRSLPSVGGFQPLTALSSVLRAPPHHPPSRMTTPSPLRISTTGTDDDDGAPPSPTETAGPSPWARSPASDAVDGDAPVARSGINSSRFRQHVNPLARKFQMPTDQMAEDWPRDGSFRDPGLPLHIDIGCGKGGFLLALATHHLTSPPETDYPRNYLGLEIRPSVAHYARSRIPRHALDGTVDVLGCNANVDLPRILHRYTGGERGGTVAVVSIQYPDPHFKKRHGKRRVVTEELVATLAEFLGAGAEVFLQSDIKVVLDGMRESVRKDGGDYFEERGGGGTEEGYLEENPTGVPTERELSVLEKDGEVYRVLFVRTGVEWRG